MADAPHRSAEQLIAALAAGEIDLREFLVEARPLRGDDVLLPAAVRDALASDVPGPDRLQLLGAENLSDVHWRLASPGL